MTALFLTVQPATASVAVAVTGAPDGPVAVTRTDVNGTVPVRTRIGQGPIAGAVTLIDYEVALAGPVAYDVVDAAQVTTTATATLSGLVPSTPRIAAVQLPQLVTMPALITGYEARRATTTTVHEPIGRADPILVLGPAQTRRGTLTLWHADLSSARVAVGVLASPYLFILRQVDQAGLDMYLGVLDARVTPSERTAQGWRWRVDVDYVEIRPPALPLLGAAGWTFDALAATYATFGALRATFPDFAAVVVGP